MRVRLDQRRCPTVQHNFEPYLHGEAEQTAWRAITPYLKSA
jgi:hypothetical protein